jgi:hypothetical protein
MASSGMNIDWLTKPFNDVMDDLNKVTDRTTMYALRQVGRLAIIAEAKARAPVYKGVDPRAVAERGQLRKSIHNARRLNKMGTGDYSLKVGPFGSTKKGTAVSRYGGGGSMAEIAAGKLNMTSHGKAGTSYYRDSKKRAGNSTKGQLRGVPLYRAQMEAEYGYMENAVAGATASIRTIYEAAMAKALEKYR